MNARMNAGWFWAQWVAVLMVSVLLSTGSLRAENPPPLVEQEHSSGDDAAGDKTAGDDTAIQEGLCLVWQPDQSEDILVAAEYFQARPFLRVSAVLPDSVFKDDERSQKARAIFQSLVTAGRMEILLTLPGDPVLPLIMDTEFARAPNLTLPARFSWPDDVFGQLGLAWNNYRRRWQTDPQGLALPYGISNGMELPMVDKARLKWVLVNASTHTDESAHGAAGYFRGVPAAVVRPFVFPTGTVSEKREWIFRWRAEALVPPPLRIRYLTEFQSLEDLLGDISQHKIWLVSEVLLSRRGLPLWPDLDRPVDFSPWIGQPVENLAWQLLGVTRQTVEEYKNSGQADVVKLDIAMKEIYAAESGHYFYAFGSEFAGNNQKETEQSFFATLSQVYRILGKTVPPALLQTDPKLAAESMQEPESIFEKRSGGMRWTDVAKDDRGPGDYFYPSGRDFLPGSWDLQVFDVRWTEKDAVFSFQMATLPNFWKAPYGFSYPMVDVYIDINRLPGAGSEILLSNRPGIVNTTDAWEFALSVDGWGARLYRSGYGQPPKLLARLPVKVPSVSPAFEVTVPRNLLRGDPLGWGYGVAVMGCEQPKSNGAEAECRPMRVLKDPSASNFGSPNLKDASSQAPPFIDILIPKGLAQKQVLDVYRQGRDVVLPFVRGE